MGDVDLIARGEIVRASLSALALRVAHGDIARAAAIDAITHTVLGLLAPAAALATPPTAC